MVKRLFKFKYPKILGLVVAIILAYLIFRNPSVSSFVSHLGNLSYLGVFIAGFIFSFGFAAPFAAGFFITLNPNNILLAGVVGGVGATLSNLLIFNLIRISFKDEFNKLIKTKLINEVKKEIEKDFGKKIKTYLMYALAGFLIASPLPNEAGDVMLAGLTHIKTKMLIILSFILSTIGILVLLLL